jgi:hypothetical protein
MSHSKLAHAQIEWRNHLESVPVKYKNGRNSHTEGILEQPTCCVFEEFSNIFIFPMHHYGRGPRRLGVYEEGNEGWSKRRNLKYQRTYVPIQWI